MSRAVYCLFACVAASTPDEYFFPFLSLTHDGDRAIHSRSKFDRHCANFAGKELERHGHADRETFAKVVSPLCRHGVEGATCKRWLTSLWNETQAGASAGSSYAHWCQEIWEAYPRAASSATEVAASKVPVQAAPKAPKALLKKVAESKPTKPHAAARLKAKVAARAPSKLKVITTTTTTTTSTTSLSTTKARSTSSRLSTTKARVATTSTTTTTAPAASKTAAGDEAAKSALANLVKLGLGDSDAAKQLRARLVGKEEAALANLVHLGLGDSDAAKELQARIAAKVGEPVL